MDAFFSAPQIICVLSFEIEMDPNTSNTSFFLCMKNDRPTCDCLYTMMMLLILNCILLLVYSFFCVFSGHSIAELQVKKLIAAIIVRPFDSSVSLMLQELLVVDALQKFGTDYELLVASKSSSCCFQDPNSPSMTPMPEGKEQCLHVCACMPVYAFVHSAVKVLLTQDLYRLFWVYGHQIREFRHETLLCT